MARRPSTRISLADRHWTSYWSSLLIDPLTAPTVDEVRDLFARHMTRSPRSIYSSRLDTAHNRWVPVPVSERRAYLEQIVVAGHDPDPNGIDDYVVQHSAPADWPAPFKIVLGQRTVLFSQNHAAGDGITFSAFAAAISTLDLEAMHLLDNHATLSTLTAGIARQLVSGGARNWVEEIRSRKRAHADVHSPSPASDTTSSASAVMVAPQSALVSSILTTAELRTLNRWGRSNHASASLSALLTSSLYLALTRQGVELDAGGHNMSLGLRAYLPRHHQEQYGNLARTVSIRADMTSPREISEAQKAVVKSGLALPALVADALRTRTSAATDANLAPSPASGPKTLSFSLMPILPGIEGLPWRPDGTKRYVGLGHATGPNGIQVYAIRLREHLDIAASFDAAAIPADAVRKALASLADASALFGD